METDSKYVLTILKNSTKLEDEGFLNSSNPKIIKSTIASFRARKTQTFVKWVKGHNGHPRNEGADDMAKRATQKEKASYINLNPPKELLVTGAKLSIMTQKLAYIGILQWKRSNGEMQRRRTTTENFWMSIRQKDLERKTREFLYLVTHDAHWTGTHWLRPSMKPELQQRAICNACGVIEDFDHIHGGTQQLVISWDVATNEVRNKWIQMVNTRLDLDCRMTLPRYERKALPEDWTTLSGVLVGITVDMEEGE
ncbi:hypothetical protein F5890DRAFT_1529964 [Lentinula detonsa]|uniref:RNase H type-1 domain-containing protein n=1 Tax=Lentinula detonsa TaxID=2804962 RepID=A0AA38URA5_9AGAR|nr:hypothetical protein F5890DRAFT_1529964 [Lentinula detonsa]